MHTINEVKEFMTPENAEDLLTNIQVKISIQLKFNHHNFINVKSN